MASRNQSVNTRVDPAHLIESLRPLARVLATMVAAELAKGSELPAPELYGSRPPYRAPPGRSHRWLRDHGRELVPFGAKRLGGKRGRDVCWTISPEGFAAYEASPAVPAVAPIVVETEGERIARLAERSGLRLTRRSA